MHIYTITTTKTAAVPLTKPSSVDDPRVRHSLETKVSLPLTQGLITIQHTNKCTDYVLCYLAGKSSKGTIQLEKEEVIQQVINCCQIFPDKLNNIVIK